MMENTFYSKIASMARPFLNDYPCRQSGEVQGAWLFCKEVQWRRRDVIKALRETRSIGELREVVYEGLLEFYRVYIERNSSFEEFADDVNTLGGNMGDWWVKTSEDKAKVSTSGFHRFCHYPLKEIWDDLRGEQLTLF